MGAVGAKNERNASDAEYQVEKLQREYNALYNEAELDYFGGYFAEFNQKKQKLAQLNEQIKKLKSQYEKDESLPW